ncbi:MAG: helix-turn-helix domain-containing protein [Candidatus Omnitrophota bacterium]
MISDTHVDLVKFGKRVNAIIVSLNLQKKEFAKSIAMSFSYISEIVAGKKKPGFEFFNSLFTVYPRLNQNYLFHGEDPMFLPDADTYEFMEKDPALRRLFWFLMNSEIVRYDLSGFLIQYFWDNEKAIVAELNRSGIAESDIPNV